MNSDNLAGILDTLQDGIKVLDGISLSNFNFESYRTAVQMIKRAKVMLEFEFYSMED